MSKYATLFITILLISSIFLLPLSVSGERKNFVGVVRGGIFRVSLEEMGANYVGSSSGVYIDWNDPQPYTLWSSVDARYFAIYFVPTSLATWNGKPIVIVIGDPTIDTSLWDKGNLVYDVNSHKWYVSNHGAYLRVFVNYHEDSPSGCSSYGDICYAGKGPEELTCILCDADFDLYSGLSKTYPPGADGYVPLLPDEDYWIENDYICVRVGEQKELKNTWYFLQITDLHLGSGSCNVSKMYEFSDFVNRTFCLSTIKPVAVIDTGDIADSTLDGYNWYEKYRNTVDFWNYGIYRLDTAGNHDVSLSFDAYYSYFGSPQYKYDIPDRNGKYIRFISVNTSRVGKTDGGIYDQQLDEIEEWLSEAESNESIRAVVIFGHHPPSPNSVMDDYKATPFNCIVAGDPWRFVRDICSYSKVIGYVYGHVHVSHVSYFRGKYFLGTAPLTLRGPWSSSPAGNYDGSGYVYRIIMVDEGKVSTAVFEVGSSPIGMITNISQGEVLSGNVTIRAFALSPSGISKITLIVDGTPVKNFYGVNVSSVGGFYECILNTSSLSDGQHKLEVYIESPDGNMYSPPVYIFVRTSGGFLWKMRSSGISFGYRENYPDCRLYVYTDNVSDYPYVDIYRKVSSGGYFRVKALMECEHLVYGTIRIRYGVATFSQNLDKIDRVYVRSDGYFPYDTIIRNETSEIYFQNKTEVARAYWYQAEKNSGGVAGYFWWMYDDFSNAERQAIRSTEEPAYCGVFMESEAGAYSHSMLMYLEVEDSNGIFGLSMVPNSLGYTTYLRINNVGYNWVSFSLNSSSPENFVRNGTVILEIFENSSWKKIWSMELINNTNTSFTIHIGSIAGKMIRLRYLPAHDPANFIIPWTSYAESVTDPIFVGYVDEYISPTMFLYILVFILLYVRSFARIASKIHRTN